MRFAVSLFASQPGLAAPRRGRGSRTNVRPTPPKPTSASRATKESGEEVGGCGPQHPYSQRRPGNGAPPWARLDHDTSQPTVMHPFPGCFVAGRGVSAAAFSKPEHANIRGTPHAGRATRREGGGQPRRGWPSPPGPLSRLRGRGGVERFAATLGCDPSTRRSTATASRERGAVSRAAHGPPRRRFAGRSGGALAGARGSVRAVGARERGSARAAAAALRWPLASAARWRSGL